MSVDANLGTIRTDDRHGIVSAEANQVRQLSEDTEKMARRRFQNPQPQRVGKWRYLLLWLDLFLAGKLIRKRKRIRLAPATMPEREVKKIAAEVLRPLNQGLTPIGAAVSFAEYVETIYKTTVLPLMANSTQSRYLSVIKLYLNPAFGSKCMRDLTPLTQQQYFSGFATSVLSYESQDKIRDVMSSILSSAVSYGILVKNPMEGVRLPRPKKGNRVKPYIDPTQFTALLELIPEPYATMVHVAAFAGLRPSELNGLRWKNVHPDSITIVERYCRGEWGAPKSKASNATIPVHSGVIDRIHRLKTITVEIRAGNAVRRYPAVKSSGPDDLVFASVVRAHP